MLPVSVNSYDGSYVVIGLGGLKGILAAINCVGAIMMTIDCLFQHPYYFFRLRLALHFAQTLSFE